MDVTTQIGNQEKDDKQMKIAAHTRSLDVTVTDADKSKIEEPIEPKIDVAKIVEATVGPKMVGSDYMTEIMEDMFDVSENKRREHTDDGMEEIATPRMVVPNAVNIVQLQEIFENLRTENDKTLSGKQSGQRGESFPPGEFVGFDEVERSRVCGCIGNGWVSGHGTSQPTSPACRHAIDLFT